MQKLFLLALLSMLSLSLYSSESETITHIVKRDRLVKSGNVYLTTQNIQSEEFTLKIDYNLSVSILFISRNLKGSKEIELPTELLDPYGYEALEEVGSREVDRARIVHRGRYQSGVYYDCHIIKVIPKGNKGWEGEFTYCPTVPSIGFIKTAITIHKVPFVGRHTIHSVIKGY